MSALEDPGPAAVPSIVTARLVLRELRPDDLDALAAVLGDPVAMAWYPQPFSREETMAWIERDRARYATAGFGHLGIELRSTGELIGDCGPTVLDIEGVPEVELGWHVRRGWRHFVYAMGPGDRHRG